MIVALLQNAALLLGMALVYDQLARRYPADTLSGKLLAGLLIGLVGIVIILSALPFGKGVFFDTRTVLMTVCGLFLGLVPTLLAAAITIVFRAAEGGAVLTGSLSIISSAVLGLGWRYLRRDRLAEIRFFELYAGGLLVHAVMLGMLLTLPDESRWDILARISLPVMLIFPLATAVLGAIFVDRLQREQLQSRLNDERRLLLALFESLPDLVWMKNTEGRYLAANPRMGELYGTAAENVIGKTDSELMSESVAEDFVATDRRVIDSGQTLTLEEWVTFASDGHRELLETTKTPIFDCGGRVASVLGVGHDISERKQVEQQLRQLAQAVEQSTESIAITNLHSEIEYVNQAFLTASGYSRDEVIGRHSSFLQSGETPQETYRQLWAALERGESWQGEFRSRRKNGELYVESAIVSPIRQPDGSVQHFLTLKRDISNQKAAQARIEYLAHYDDLTGLPNRVRFTDRLAILLTRSQQGALIIVDLDQFRTINDARGFAFGDALLQLTAQRLQSLLGDEEVVARFSADEFAVLLPGLPAHRSLSLHQYAEEVAARIHAAFRDALEVDDEEVTLSVSLGATLFPQRGDAAADIINRADTAMHRAKAAGGNQTAFFDTQMGEQARDRYVLEGTLRSALQAGQLAVYLQSQMSREGHAVAAEALMRWNHPERGLVLPGLFIPIAEQSDLIVELGEWMLTEVCRLIAEEAAAGRRLRIAANLSPRQFRKPDFVSWLKQLLDTSKASPDCLTLEVTEGLMIDNMDVVVDKMNEVAALGVHFSVDDFGTGYSSLSYLKRLPIRELKIDKSFVQDLPDDRDDVALVDTILAVARNLNLSVVAEGVETQAQVDFLNTRGNIIYQGYFYDCPSPAADWLASWRRR